MKRGSVKAWRQGQTEVQSPKTKSKVKVENEEEEEINACIHYILGDK